MLSVAIPYHGWNSNRYISFNCIDENQVDAMRTYSNDAGIAHFLNSSLNKSAIAQVRNDVLEGRTKLLYFAPEFAHQRG